MSQGATKLLPFSSLPCRSGSRFARCCSLLLGVLLAAPALADTHTWTDGSAANSNWNEPGNWSPAGPPVFGDDVIVTPGLLGTLNPVEVNVFASVANVQVVETVGGEGEVRIQAGRDLVINGGDLVNDGLVVVNSDGGTAAARLRFSAFAGDFDQTLSGNGTVLLQGGAEGFFPPTWLASIDTISSVLTQAAGHTIRGVGQIRGTIVNQGDILAADLPAAPGSNVLELTDIGLTNNGTLGAEAGGTLDIIRDSQTPQITQGATGVISAADGGFVRLRNSVFITGGTLQTKGTGKIITSSSPAGQFATRLTDVTNEGDYQVNPGGAVFIAGSGFTNDGTVNLSGFMSYLNSGTLDGSGEMVLAGGAVVDTQAGVTLTHAAGHTIRGSGQINAQLVNDGLIQAEGTLRLVGDATTNNHELRAASGGTLQVENFVTQHPTTGLIVADDGGTVKLMSSGRMTEGRLQSLGSGLFQAGDGTRLIDVTNEATINVQPITANGTVLVEGAGITNNGTIVVNPSSVGGTYAMSFNGAPQMTLGGSGVVDLNHTNSFLNVTPGTVNAAGHTIAGRGQINGEIVNEGSIAGDANHLPIQINGKLSGTGDLQNIRLEGTHAPGNNGPHQAVVVGTYDMNPGAKLEIEIGGYTYGTDTDWVDVLGSITLAGTLDVKLIGGFVPASPAGFPIVTSTVGRTGMFTNEILPDLPGGFYFELEYTAFSVNLAVKGIAGDYNQDGIVDAADYIVWRSMAGQSGSALAADGDADGNVDGDDYDVWQAAFGQVAPGAAPPNHSFTPSVPEPASWALAVCALAGFFGIRRVRCANFA